MGLISHGDQAGKDDCRNPSQYMENVVLKALVQQCFPGRLRAARAEQRRRALEREQARGDEGRDHFCDEVARGCTWWRQDRAGNPGFVTRGDEEIRRSVCSSRITVVNELLPHSKELRTPHPATTH